MSEVGLHSLRPEVPRERTRRVGRGPGSGRGKTSGKGHKGQKARAGGVKGPGFEGGQMPLQMRVPKRGFTNAPFRRRSQIVHLSQLSSWPADVEVTEEALQARGIVDADRSRPVKLLADGEPAGGLRVRLQAVSAGARAKIEASGGSVLGTEPETGA